MSPFSALGIASSLFDLLQSSTSKTSSSVTGLADGTELAAQKLSRLLTNDPGMGVIRHVDAGYERAEEVAKERGVRIPMQEG